MVKKIKHEHPVLVGVSFGGLLVQEMARYLETRKVISRGIDAANHSPITEKFSVGVIQT